jgi:hypothetical protein
MRNDLAEVRPSEEAMFDRFARNFSGLGVPKGERVEDLGVEVAISLDEADRGTRVRLGVSTRAKIASRERSFQVRSSTLYFAILGWLRKATQ